MATISLGEPVYRGKSGPVFFAAGFRPFFLFAAVQAAIMLPLWLAVYVGGVSLNLPFADALWHGHEMVFGFAGAALGGFLLTAVPNWTNTAPVSGRPLMALFALWLAGRVVFTLAGYLSPLLVAAIDLSYAPVLAVLMARPLIQAGKRRNLAFLGMLLLFLAANGCVHAGLILGRHDPMTGVHLGIVLLLTMIAMVGGRIIPSFTQNWLRMQGIAAEIHPVAWIEKGGAVASVLVSGVAAVAFPHSPLSGGLLLAAAVIQLVRLAGWQGWRTLVNPILGVLHVGYLWLAVGLVLSGLSHFIPDLTGNAALHALTAGCIGTMVMAVMTRAALGHSGRPLQVPASIVAAYGLLSVGAMLRVAAPLLPDAQMILTHAGGSLWALAWGLFILVYAPIVIRPRADGRPG